MNAVRQAPRHPPERAFDPDGQARTIRFPPFWHAYVARQTEPRLAVLDELVDAHVERRVLRRYLRRLKHATLFAFVTAAAAAHWFSDQIAWLTERMPALRAFWTLITGGAR
ncbi:hypothetical protein MKK65_15540 [Methylobacterium sp. J-001]|uniref:hypothetical protein n=1 Tax=Methylobacterium sp. J-001 TaxID=2836609 RepID=UPI001FBA6D80|nr:hypothetical protein [Methylobacterium sp. J-001]MCJ2117961.1 hypothetical protein [Methylobacterium sp. J-001]